MSNDNQNIISTLQKQSSTKHNTPETIGRLQRTIKRLSKDLYSSESHYLYELIQNADDNKYEDGDIPKLRLELKVIELEGERACCLILSNNEKGFSEKDVRAICDVDDSTKSEDLNTIGEKGIGFKSVFRITDCPYIISNEYAFKLPEKNPHGEKGLGYIIPYAFDTKSIKCAEATCIILPLSKEKKPYQIASQLENLNENSILFLRKLRCLEIEVSLPKISFKRKVDRTDDHHFRLLTITNGNQKRTSKFFIHESLLEKPNHVTHENRKNITGRLVSVAIPIDKEDYKGILYSYLPVWEDTGLPFLINSDFLLTSDRENLHKEYDWNIWLRDAISTVFVEGLVELLNHSDIELEEKILTYKSIPIAANNGFLKPIVDSILDDLKDESIVLSYKTQKLFKPAEIKIGYSNLIGLFESSKELPISIKEDQFPLTWPDILTDQTTKVFERIGVKKLYLNDLGKHFLSDVSWIQPNSMDWFCSLYDYLRSKKFSKGKLKAYELVPVKNSDSLRSAQDTNLYFQVTDNEVYKSLSESIRSLLNVAEVNQDLVSSYLKKDKKAKKLWMEEQLGIYDFVPKNLGVDLVNLIKNNSDKLSSDGIIELTENLHSLDPKLLSDEALLLVEENGDVYDSANEEIEIVVPSDYNKNNGWQHLYKEKDRSHFKIVSDKYSKVVLKALAQGDSVLRFFPRFKRNKLDCGSSPKTTSGKELVDYLKRNSANDHYWKLSAYEVLIPLSLSNANLNEQVSSAIVSFLKSCDFKSRYDWEEEIPQQQMVDAGLYNKGYYFHRGKNRVTRESSIYNYLKDKAWLFTEKHGFQVPSSVFLQKKEITEILGDSVPYVKGIKNELLINFLGLKSALTRQSLIDYLIDAQKGKVDLKVITKIYSQLDQRTNDDNGLSQNEKTKNLIYISKEDNWVDASECIWKSPKVIDEEIKFHVLSSIYPESLKSFFLNKLGVSEDLSIEYYISRWKAMQEGQTAIEETALKGIYKRLKQHVIKQDIEEVNEFVEEAEIYSPNKQLFYDPSEIYFPDDPKQKKLFEDYAPLAFIPKGEGYAEWLEFYKPLKVPVLSEHVRMKVSDHSEIDRLKENKYLTPFAIKLVAAYIMTKNIDGYKELLANKAFLNLVHTKEFISVDDIPITINLDDEYEIEAFNPVYFSLDDQQLCFKKDADRLDIAIAVYNVINKIITIPRHAINPFELYLSEVSLKRKTRSGLATPHEVYELLDKLESENDSSLDIDQVQKQNDNKIPEEEQESDEAESETNDITNDNEIPSQYPERDDSSTAGSTGQNNPDNKSTGRSRTNISTSTNGNSDGARQRSNQNKFNESNNQSKPAYNDYKPNDQSNYQAPAYQKPKSGKRRSQSNYSSEESSTQADLNKETRKLDKERNKLADSRKHLGRKSKLLAVLKNESKFTFRWLKILTELEYLNDIEKSKSSAYNLTFNQVSLHVDVILLDFPNRYVSSRIEQYENLKLVLYTEEKTITISVQSVSVNRYSVRAKLWKSSDIKNLDQDTIEKAVLKIASVDFLWQTLLDQLHQVQKDHGINDKAPLQKLIKDKNISFIFGPPGTGKTTTILSDYILPDLKSGTNKTLVLTPTNKAADVITERLIEKEIQGKYFRFGSTGNEMVEQHDCYIAKKMNKLESSYTFISTIARFPYDVISYDSDDSSLPIRAEVWDKVILDEASMINLPQIIGLILSVPKETEIIIVGDPFQIKPILNLPEWNEANIYDLVGLNSFNPKRTSQIKFPIKRLKKQYRSLLHVGSLYGEYSYDGLLEGDRGNLGKPKFMLFKSVPLKCLNLLTFPLNQDTTLYSSKYLDKSSYHLYLAIFLVEWLLKFVQQFSEEKKRIGIISPYRAQSDLLYKLINANHDKLNGCNVLVSTVHGFQGDECDIIICALNPPKSKSNRVVLNNKNVLNVAISRAKERLFIKLCLLT